MPASRKLYTELAVTLRRYRDIAADHPIASTRAAQVAIVDALIGSLASDLKQDNMRFDTARFLTASGVVTRIPTERQHVARLATSDDPEDMHAATVLSEFVGSPEFDFMERLSRDEFRAEA